jgi:poly-gamma-glutamate capsule biosynthesis protein CapA/YwtB (metallophosphatase superfamily)
MSESGRKNDPPDPQSQNVVSERIEGKPLRLALLGDCMFGRLVNEVLESAPPAYPWGDTLPILLGADYRICNLECVLSDRGEPWSAYPKAFHFRSAAKNVAVLEAARINAVSLANNHVLDYGYDAMFETLKLLDRAGIAHSGAGAAFEEASRPAISEVGGRKIGLLAFTDNEPAWAAAAHEPGVFYVPVDRGDSRAQALLDTVRKEKDRVDLLVVSAHWGGNWGYYPPRAHVELARALVDAGASLVFGHSSHVFRGIEFYKGRPVLYSAGNFVDDYAVDQVERNDQSFVYLADIEDARFRGLRLYPTLIRRCQARRAAQAFERSIADKMRELCAGMDTSAEWNPEQRCLELPHTAT